MSITDPSRVYILELGGDDDRFAACEAQNAASVVAPVATGVAISKTIDSARVRGLAFTQAASEFVGITSADPDQVLETVASMVTDRTGTIAVRARRVRGSVTLDSQRMERAVGSALVDHGFDVDLTNPDHEFRVISADDFCFLGWLVVRSERTFEERQPSKKPFFQPGSMDSRLARAIANIAGASPGVTILDPMCGTGGLLIEAGLLNAGVIGVDIQPKMIAGASANCKHYLGRDRWSIIRGDARRMPIHRDQVDAVVFDAPYGRQSKITGTDGESLIESALHEAGRVSRRAVVIADRPIIDIANATEWTICHQFARRVHASLTRYISVIDRQ